MDITHSLNKVLITPWFGPQPPWMEKYWMMADCNIPEYEFMFGHDVAERVSSILKMDINIKAGASKAHDLRPAFGMLFADELRRVDYWGWCDFDIVWGKVHHFYPDKLISQYDVVSDCLYDYVSGPFTLIRNTKRMRELFMECPEWKYHIQESETTGWSEGAFTQLVKREVPSLLIANHHSWDRPELLRLDEDGTLKHDGREVAYHHFRHTKEWPL